MTPFEFLVGILILFAGTLGGAYLGYRYGVSQDRIARAENQDETIKRCRESLLNLVQENIDRLKTGYTMQSYNHIAFWSILKTDVLESIISSTNITLFDLSTQSALTDYLEDVRSLNMYTERLEGEDEHSKIVRILTSKNQSMKL